jgi:hypothetical protein
MLYALSFYVICRLIDCSSSDGWNHMACFTCDSLDRDIKAERDPVRKKEMEAEKEDHIEQLVCTIESCDFALNFIFVPIPLGCAPAALYDKML